MTVEIIKAALESLKVEGVHNEALNDCITLAGESIVALENHLDSILWLAENVDFDKVYPTEAEKQYAINLGSVEESLVHQGLIYN